MVSKQTLRLTARLFTKTFFQTTKTPKIVFENNTWSQLAKAVLGKAVKKNEKVSFAFATDLNRVPTNRTALTIESSNPKLSKLSHRTAVG